VVVGSRGLLIEREDVAGVYFNVDDSNMVEVLEGGFLKGS
jgi:hypothetical protein